MLSFDTIETFDNINNINNIESYESVETPADILPDGIKNTPRNGTNIKSLGIKFKKGFKNNPDIIYIIKDASELCVRILIFFLCFKAKDLEKIDIDLFRSFVNAEKLSDDAILEALNFWKEKKVFDYDAVMEQSNKGANMDNIINIIGHISKNINIISNHRLYGSFNETETTEELEELEEFEKIYLRFNKTRNNKKANKTDKVEKTVKTNKTNETNEVNKTDETDKIDKPYKIEIADEKEEITEFEIKSNIFNITNETDITDIIDITDMSIMSGIDVNRKKEETKKFDKFDKFDSPNKSNEFNDFDKLDRFEDSAQREIPDSIAVFEDFDDTGDYINTNIDFADGSEIDINNDTETKIDIDNDNEEEVENHLATEIPQILEIPEISQISISPSPHPSSQSSAILPPVSAISLDNLIESFETNEKFGYLVGAVQDKMRMIFNTSELEILYNLYEIKKIEPDLILKLAEACVEDGKNNVRYLEKYALGMSANGILTAKDYEVQLNEVRRTKEFEEKIKNMFGIGNKKLNAKERKYIKTWDVEFNFSDDLLSEGYKICMEKQEQLNIPYIDGIFNKWREKGFKTLDDVRNEFNNQGGFGSSGSKKVSSFNIEQFFEKAVAKARQS